MQLHVRHILFIYNSSLASKRIVHYHLVVTSNRSCDSSSSLLGGLDIRRRTDFPQQNVILLVLVGFGLVFYVAQPWKLWSSRTYGRRLAEAKGLRNADHIIRT